MCCNNNRACERISAGCSREALECVRMNMYSGSDAALSDERGECSCNNCGCNCGCGCGRSCDCD